ncbi:MAG TPA: L,D-transpeptidase [Candidatus Obscuribacterales bacterium]
MARSPTMVWQSGGERLAALLMGTVALLLATPAAIAQVAPPPTAIASFPPVALAGVEPPMLTAAAPPGTTLPNASALLPTTPQRASRLVLRRSARQLDVYQGDRLLATYPVAIGRSGWETPVGEFTIQQRIPHPTWQHPFTGELVPPGPENPLGARWLGFWTDGVNAIGFHGTPDEASVGKAISHGCVRLRHSDVVALYRQVRVGTPVTVLP